MDTLERVQTPTLEVAYQQWGPAGGPPVLLLHGFPDDAGGWAGVAERLAAAGRRVLAPYLRGCGPTRFRRPDTPRDGRLAALGQDALDFAEALDLRDLCVVGQDWGSPAAEVLAAVAPGRVGRLVKLNHYGVYTTAEQARGGPPNYPQLQALWYVWLLATPVGRQVVEHDRRGFARALWENWSPTWDPAARAAALAAAAGSFDNPDWAAVALSAYRNGLADAPTDPRHDALAGQLADPPPVRAATRLVTGADDGVERSPLSDAAAARYFPGGLRREVLAGVGHFVHRERPDAVAAAVLGET